MSIVHFEYTIKEMYFLQIYKSSKVTLTYFKDSTLNTHKKNILEV